MKRFYFVDENGVLRKKETWIEKAVREILMQEQISYIQEHPIKYKNFYKVYDFLCHHEDETKLYTCLIEVHGDHWHGYDFYFEGVQYSKLKKIQKRNMRNDKIKSSIAKELGIPLLWIWEKDLKDRKDFVIQQIKDFIAENTKKF